MDTEKPCGKRGFERKRDAETALNYVSGKTRGFHGRKTDRRRARTERVECRVYCCPICQLWHLTSKR